jgi:hypothetical protein
MFHRPQSARPRRLGCLLSLTHMYLDESQHGYDGRGVRSAGGPTGVCRFDANQAPGQRGNVFLRVTWQPIVELEYLPLPVSYRGRQGQKLCKCVSVPERFSLVFSNAERLVVDHFSSVVRNPSAFLTVGFVVGLIVPRLYS